MFKAILLASALLFAQLSYADPVVIKTQTEVGVTTTSALGLVANQSRKYLLILNKGSANVIVKFGSAHSASEGVVIPAGGNYEPFQSPVDAVYLKSASGTQNTLIVEGI